MVLTRGSIELINKIVKLPVPFATVVRQSFRPCFEESFFNLISPTRGASPRVVYSRPDLSRVQRNQCSPQKTYVAEGSFSGICPRRSPFLAAQPSDRRLKFLVAHKTTPSSPSSPRNSHSTDPPTSPRFHYFIRDTLSSDARRTIHHPGHRSRQEFFPVGIAFFFYPQESLQLTDNRSLEISERYAHVFVYYTIIFIIFRQVLHFLNKIIVFFILNWGK